MARVNASLVSRIYRFLLLQFGFLNSILYYQVPSGADALNYYQQHISNYSSWFLLLLPGTL